MSTVCISIFTNQITHIYTTCGSAPQTYPYVALISLPFFFSSHLFNSFKNLLFRLNLHHTGQRLVYYISGIVFITIFSKSTTSNHLHIPFTCTPCAAIHSPSHPVGVNSNPSFLFLEKLIYKPV